MAIVALFMFVLMSMGPFAGTVTGPETAWRLDMFTNGAGLRLSFQTPEMIIHPILVFAGYAFCLCIFSASLAHFITRDGDWTVTSRPWSRLAWLFITLGIGVGAIWAYYVIGYGGYWSWDPVETSSLLIWILITAFLHAQSRHARGKEYNILAPALGMFCFISVIFTTFITRAGGLWIGSVHTFNTPTGQAAGERLIEVLERNPQVSGLFSLIIVLLVLTSYLSLVKYRSISKEHGREGKEARHALIDDKNNMFLAVAIMVVAILAMLLILFKNADATQASNYFEFNQKVSVFAVAIMVTMTICLTWRSIGAKMALRFAVLLIVASIILMTISLVVGFDPVVGFSLPSFLVAVVASAARLVRSSVKGSVRKRVRDAAPQFVHLGVALLLVGYVLSSNLQIVPTNGEPVPLHVGEMIDVGDYSMRLVSLDMEDRTPPASIAYNAVGTATFDISRSGSPIESGTVVSNLYSVSGAEMAKASTGVLIHKAVLEDLYLHFDWKDNDTAMVNVKVIPLINVLWAGLAALSIGMTLLVFSRKDDTSSEHSVIADA
jgi:cytochrome c biogenesis factor